MTGRVYLIGAGPGAPDLVTLRAAEILGRADVVFHDFLVHPETLALAVRAEKTAVGKRSGRRSTAQQFINKRLIDAARRHAVVVRLKGGDPMLFGRAQEEIDALRRAGVDFEIVPGVTAATAAAAELGVSLTRRGLSRQVVFVTPRAAQGERRNDWAASVLAADTAVLYMGAGLAPTISAELIRRGKAADTPVALVESASLPERRLLFGSLSNLPELARRTGSGPAIVLFGEVLKAALARRGPALDEEIDELLRRA
ncbi:MAG TPA: uroporphyrinogen-III C-methyltransferase [Burkholderiales bacterium]|nr:uroporphyrinogen-III C-methyltransferase [Burkholderiales bacterium]